jgi:LysM repeat protein
MDPQTQKTHARLATIEYETEDLKRSLIQITHEQSANEKKLNAYGKTLDALQRGCADARALEEMARSADAKAEKSAKRAEEIQQLRAQISDTLRLVEQAQKKVQVLESHLQSYWQKIDALLLLKKEVAELKNSSNKISYSQTTLYTVESGDSIDYIARKFGTDPEAIAKLNRLTSTTLQEGQTLHIPKSK